MAQRPLLRNTGSNPASCFPWSCIKLPWASQGADVAKAVSARSRRSARLVRMFNATLIVIEAFIRELRTMYERTYTTLEPDYPGIISFVAQLALENIATSDAAYHDVDHTIMVTLVGQEILRGR